MKKFGLIICFGICLNLSAQEFPTYENGLIYSPRAMEKLKGMVGDKNEEFRVCDYEKKFYSTEQTKGRIFHMGEVDWGVLAKDLKANISLKDFEKNYSYDFDKDDLVLLSKYDYVDYNEKQMVGISERPDGSSLEMALAEWPTSHSKNWVWSNRGKRTWLVYLERPFETFKIPERYSRMIQYSECLIDTTSQIFTADASRMRWYSENDSTRIQQEKFMNFITDEYVVKPPELEYDENMSQEETMARYDSLQRWENAKKGFVKLELSKKPEFKRLLNRAYDEALKNQSSTDEFEYYVAHYLSPSKSLTLKRNRIVVGQCSMDDSPRIHAMNIAQLAGESVNWDIFLRSHLNVLNDNVNRVSDGSWAWEARKTYIRELEELDIEVKELLLGTALRASNTAEGHYFGNIGRLGRAISESKDVNEFEDELYHMIDDQTLDDFNRLLMFYLHDNLVYHMDTSKEKHSYKNKRNMAKSLLPNYISDKLD